MSAARTDLGEVISPAPEEKFSAEKRVLRVLTLTPFYPSTQDRTLGCFVSEPLSGIARFGIENEVIAVQPFYRSRAYSVQSEISSNWKAYFSLPGNLGLPTSGHFLAADLMRKVRKMHRVRAFDLIHAHSTLPCGHAAELLSKNLDIPFVVSVHGLDAFSTRQARGAMETWCRRVSAHVYRSARVVICISDKVRECVARAVPANTAVVYNGVDAEMFSPACETQPTESKSPLIVLSVGNLIPIKGHALLLRAFARIPNCALEIIGDGPERGNLVRLARELAITNEVRFLGRQSREKVSQAMRRCAVFALPSRYEGLGCVYLEAMASGKPAIGCRGQGIDELIEHGRNGLLISAESETELRDSLSMLLHNAELRHRIGTQARNTVVEHHTLTHQARQLAGIYRECVR
jgi:teichuronic acid biosynthesis glycosyltransferase TuaC